MIGLRPMTLYDLGQVEAWMAEPHVAPWWTPDTTAQAMVEEYRRRVSGEEMATSMLMVSADGEAIGEPGALGRGLGVQMIAALVQEVRRHHPGAGVLVDPQAANQPSRRALEANGFRLVAVRQVAGEGPAPRAIYRLSGSPLNMD